MLIWLALAIVTIPLRWVVAWCVAVAVHEAYHYFAIRLCAGRVYSVQLGLFGAVMESELSKQWQELLCALAGPLGSISLLLVAKWLPRIAICGVLHGLYNLLPLFPMDGGRALRCLLQQFFSVKVSNIVEKFVAYLTNAGLLLVGLYGSVILRLGVVPLVAVSVPIIKNLKIPCKERVQQVQ